jgi:hypothetical protein
VAVAGAARGDGVSAAGYGPVTVAGMGDDLLEDLAWCDLPSAGYEALARSGSGLCRMILTVNPGTPQQVLAMLPRRGRGVPGRRPGQMALARITDPGLLTAKTAASSALYAAGIAANPHTPTELLTDLTGHPSEQVRRAATLNPATPVQAIIAAAAAFGSVHDYIGPASSRVATYARYARIMTVHPELAGVWLTTDVLNGRTSNHSSTIRRAVARMPGLPRLNQRIVKAIVTAPGATGMVELAMNPDVPTPWLEGRLTDARERLYAVTGGLTTTELFDGRPLDQAALASAGSATLDLMLAGYDGLTFDTAKDLFTTRGGSNSGPDPDMLAQLIARFGPDLATVGDKIISATRWAAVHDQDPMIGLARTRPAADRRDRIAALAAKVGDRRDRWEIVTGLANGWDGTVEDMLDAATIV